MMPKIYTRSLADLTPEQQQEVLSRARNKGYEIVVGDQPIAMPTLREMASTPGSELSEFIRGQGGSMGQIGMADIGAGKPSPTENLELAGQLGIPTATAVGALAGFALSGGNPAGAYAGAAAGNFAGERGYAYLAKAKGHPEMAPSLTASALRSPLVALPTAFMGLGGRAGARSAGIPEATIRETQRRALSNPLGRTSVQEITSAPSSTAELSMGKKLIQEARELNAKASPALAPRDALLKQFDDIGLDVSGSDVVDSLLYESPSGIDPSLSSGKAAIKEMEKIAETIMEQDVDYRGRIPWTRFRKRLSEWQSEALDKQAQTAVRKTLAKVQHQVAEKADKDLRAIPQLKIIHPITKKPIVIKGEEAADLLQELDDSIGFQRENVKSFGKAVGTSKIRVYEQKNQAENFVRNYYNSSQATKELVNNLDPTGRLHNKLMTLGMRRQWNPDDTKRGQELYMYVARGIQRLPVVQQAPIAKALLVNQGVAIPFSSYVGQMLQPSHGAWDEEK